MPEMPNEFDQLDQPVDPDHNPSAQAVEEAYEALEKERDRRKEERFLFVLVGLVLFNTHVLGDMENWAAPLVIGLIQLFGLLIFARQSGVEEVQQWLDKVLDAVKPDRSRVSEQADSATKPEKPNKD